MKKFKFTWGHGMVLALLAFMIFILSFLFRFSANKGNSMDLVREDYYNASVNYQERVDALKRGTSLHISKPFEEVNGNLLISLPDSLDIKEGEVIAYRAEGKHLDRKFDLRLDNGKMMISGEAFKQGRYELSLNWKDSKDSTYIIVQNLVWK